MDILTALAISARALRLDAGRVRLVAAEIAATRPTKAGTRPHQAISVFANTEQAANGAILRVSRARITATLNLLRPPAR